jgi:hypothetical protein
VEASSAVRYRRGIIRAVTPEAVAEQLAEIRRVASAFGVEAVAPHLEQAAGEALAMARSEQEADLARQLLVAARKARFGRTVRR